MTHTIEIETEELDMLLRAIRAQETKCKTIGNAGITGHGRSSEVEKRYKWRREAEEWAELESKIANQCIS